MVPTNLSIYIFKSSLNQKNRQFSFLLIEKNSAIICVLALLMRQTPWSLQFIKHSYPEQSLNPFHYNTLPQKIQDKGIPLCTWKNQKDFIFDYTGPMVNRRTKLWYLFPVFTYKNYMVLLSIQYTQMHIQFICLALPQSQTGLFCNVILQTLSCSSYLKYYSTYKHGSLSSSFTLWRLSISFYPLLDGPFYDHKSPSDYFIAQIVMREMGA